MRKTAFGILVVFFGIVGICIAGPGGQGGGKGGGNGGGPGGGGKSEDLPLLVQVFDFATDGTAYSIRSDGAGNYLDGVGATETYILGNSGNLIFRAAGIKDCDPADRTLTFTFGPCLDPWENRSGSFPSIYHPSRPIAKLPEPRGVAGET